MGAFEFPSNAVQSRAKNGHFPRKTLQLTGSGPNEIPITTYRETRFARRCL